MTIFDAFRYDGKRVLVVGGATGMGAAAAQLALDAGAEVIVLDIKEITLDGVKAVHVDLADRASIDAALEQVDGHLDALFACAGVADGTPGIERVNFIAHRYVIESLLARGVLGRGSAIGCISSAAGLGWESNLTQIKELLATTDYDSAVRWVEENNKGDYMSSKQAICAYVASEAFPLLKQGIRINGICPGPTRTPLAEANAETWLGFAADYREEVDVDVSTPLEQAYPLVFLCSDAAAAITGITMITDVGYISSGITGSFPPATMVAGFLLNR